MKKQRVLLIITICFAALAVFAALNDTFAWLNFFRAGKGQNFQSGFVRASFTATYATYPNPVGTANGKYRYVPGDDLTTQPTQQEIDAATPGNVRRLGFNLSYAYTTQTPYVLRFKVTYATAATGAAVYPAYDAGYAYSVAMLAAKDAAMVHVAFNNTSPSAYVLGGAGGLGTAVTDADNMYWYYVRGGSHVLAATGAPGASTGNMFTSLQLVGENIDLDNGRITITVIAQIRQYETVSGGTEIVTWTDYRQTEFVII